MASFVALCIVYFNSCLGNQRLCAHMWCKPAITHLSQLCPSTFGLQKQYPSRGEQSSTLPLGSHLHSLQATDDKQHFNENERKKIRSKNHVVMRSMYPYITDDQLSCCRRLLTAVKFPNNVFTVFMEVCQPSKRDQVYRSGMIWIMSEPVWLLFIDWLLLSETVTHNLFLMTDIINNWIIPRQAAFVCFCSGGLSNSHLSSTACVCLHEWKRERQNQHACMCVDVCALTERIKVTVNNL